MTRHHWSTFTVFPIPTATRPVETLNEDLITTTKHHSVRSYLAHRLKQAPFAQFKSVRHPATGMGSATVEIRWRLDPAHIRKEANQ